MANTLTNLIPDIYEAMDIVSREVVGMIPASTLDADASRAAVGQAVRSHVAPASAAEDITPGTTPPDTGDQTFGNTSLTITKSRAVPFRWNGEESRSLDNGGHGRASLQVSQIAQALRTLVNEVEVDLAAAMKVKGSRAYGTAGTTPWGSAIDPTAGALQILKDNGSPMGDLQMVINTTAGFNMRKLGQLTKVNEAGDDDLLRRGVLLNIHGFDIRESAGIASHTKGTGTGYLVDLVAGYAVGDTTIHVDTGTGTILAGDIVTFAGDTNKYIVVSGFAGDGDGDITIGAPGLQQTLADGVAMTIGASFTPNLFFHKSASVLLARQPALPEEGDSAADRMELTDPISGITFEFAMYTEYRRVRYQVGLAWGVGGIKEEHAGTLLG